MFTVAVNHLKSKGSDCNDIGDPDAGDGQGNCNDTRTRPPRRWSTGWPPTRPASGDPDFLIVGDLNSYAMEDPITAIKAGPDDAAGTSDDYTNLIKQYLGTYAYSYVFDGQAGYLDYALSSATLTDQVTGAAEWHINADEADVLDYDMTFKSPGRTGPLRAGGVPLSDHDWRPGRPRPARPAGHDLRDSRRQPEHDGRYRLRHAARLDGPGLGKPTGSECHGHLHRTGVGRFGLDRRGRPYTTDANGNLIVTAHANTVAGSYQLAVAAGGASANFSLTNNPGNPASVRVNAGDNQSTVVNTDFPTQLDLTVLRPVRQPRTGRHGHLRRTGVGRLGIGRRGRAPHHRLERQPGCHCSCQCDRRRVRLGSHRRDGDSNLPPDQPVGRHRPADSRRLDLRRVRRLVRADAQPGHLQRQ